MPPTRNSNTQRWVLPKEALAELVDTLGQDGYTVIAPTIREEVVAFREIRSADEIARGKRDTQAGGHYRLVDGPADQYFEYVVGPESPKRHFFPPVQKLFSLQASGKGFEITASPPQAPKLAMVGVRPCEVAAILTQNRVFGVSEGQQAPRSEAEIYYRQVARQVLLVAVNCTRPGGTCFCSSMGTGPAVSQGYDLALTELRAGFVVRVGSDRGQALLRRLSTRAPSASELELEELKLVMAGQRMGRQLDTRGVPELLDEQIEHPRWAEVAKRCLSCGNCTMVCPTCFCSTVVDSNSLADGSVTRTRYWESCHTHQFSATTSGPVRNTIRARYRHWLRHKMSTWWQQFGSSGCVGCGRCITWCPKGIDLTEEIAAIRGDHGGAARAQRESEVA